MTIKIFKEIFLENIFKNVLILIFVILFFDTLFVSLQSVDQSKVNDFLLTISILLVTVCFANFAFSYEFSDLSHFMKRILSHASTFVFMLLIAFLLEALVVSMMFVYPSLFKIILLFSFLLYLGVVFYDFWDLFRAFK